MTAWRTERSVLADWWFSIDRVLLATFLVLAAAGMLLSLAASPAVAIRRGMPTFYFVERHALYVVVSLAVMVAVSFLSGPAVRRLALGVMLVSLLLMGLVVLAGTEVNGAKRWLRFAGYSLQPSEFAKPAFAVLVAWCLAESLRRPDMPARLLALALYAVFVSLLVLQPDVGQTVLVSIVGMALMLLAGSAVAWLLAFAPLLLAGLGAAYASFGYVRVRIDKFLFPGSGETFQTDRALQSFVEGGLFGKGPGEGTIKTVLPDAHTDFIFAVIGEEFGVLSCLVLVGLFALLAVRAFVRAGESETAFDRLAAAGLTLLIVLQALINMAVNVGLLPAKGMTLPFISSGGSSMLAVGLSAGLLLAVTRSRAQQG